MCMKQIICRPYLRFLLEMKVVIWSHHVIADDKRKAHVELNRLKMHQKIAMMTPMLRLQRPKH